MGGIPVRLRAWGVGPDFLPRLEPSCRRLVQELERQLSGHRDDSDVAGINRAGDAGARVRGPTLQLVGRALDWARRTDGAFDPTASPLLALWRGAAGTGRWPDEGQIAVALARVGHARVRVAEGRVFVPPGGGLDLGAIAKGYVADRLAQLLRHQGALRTRVSVGGDLRLIDDRAIPERFKVGVKRPGREGVVGVLSVGAGGVATSGCTERYAEIAGRRACHVVDPRSGQPVPVGTSVTAVALDGTDADALATALLVLGPRRGMELVEATRGVEALFVVEVAEQDRRAPPGEAGYTLLASSGLIDRIAVPDGGGGGRAPGSAMP